MDASRASGITPALVVFADYRPGRRLTHTPTDRGFCATRTQPEASSVATHGTGLKLLTCANPNGYGPPVQVVAGRVAYVTGLKYSSTLGLVVLVYVSLIAHGKGPQRIGGAGVF